MNRHKMSFSLFAMVPDMISFDNEEKEHEHLHFDIGIGVSDNTDIDKSIYNGQRLDVRPTNNDLPDSATPNRRPSRHAIQGGLLKSSLKSTSLRNSQTSTESDLSVSENSRKCSMQSFRRSRGVARRMDDLLPRKANG